MMKMTEIPIFVEAPTKQELVQRMFEINQKSGQWNNFFDIQKDGNKWIAWYYFDLNPLTRAKK